MNKQILVLLALITLIYSQCTLVPNCTTCPDPLGAGCTDCNDGFRLSGSTPNDCVACEVNGCANCDANLSQCTACDTDDDFMATPINLTTCGCANGFFLNSSSSDCQTCTIAGCTRCSSAEICTTCNATANFVTNGTSCRCADGFYLHSNNTCVACTEWHANCLTCNSSRCLTCSGDFIANTSGTNCVRVCNITGCLDCFNSTTCRFCGANSVPSGDLTNCNCNGGFFRSGTNCAACIANCASCTAATGCTTCNNGYRFNSNSSTCVLSENYVRLAFAFIVLAVLSFTM